MDEYSDNEYEDSFQRLDDETKPVFPSASGGKNVSSSVQEFLKQSNEIQEEIRKLSELCQQISPKKDSDFEEAGKSKDDFDQGAIVWDHINKLLATHGFGQIVLFRDEDDQESPDISSLSDTLVELLTEYSNLARSCADLKEESKSMDEEIKELRNQAEKAKKAEAQFRDIDKVNRQLQERLNKCRLEIKAKDETIAKLSANRGKGNSDRPSAVFRNFMEQEFNPMREGDARVMALIQNYEEQKWQAEVAGYKKEIEGFSQAARKNKERSMDEGEFFERQKRKLNAEEESEMGEKVKVMNNVLGQLRLKSYTELPNAISKIQQVMLTLPGVDKFVKQICDEIMINPNSRLEEVTEKLKEMKKRLRELEKFRVSINEGLGVGSDAEIMERLNGLLYFCKLFEIRQKDDIIATIESVFFFVHEMKMFLAVSNIQYARKMMGLQSDCGVKIVLEEVMKGLNSEPVGYYR
jgi:uncharacterized phage infection (PIP) family protein YhgE